VPQRPRGLLFDYGGTLVEECGFDSRAGIEVLLRAADPPPTIDLEVILARADRVTREVADRRRVVHIETPWTSLTRLIYDCFEIRFNVPLADLELAFWNASVQTRPMPGAHDALSAFRELGVPMGVVSNCSFGQRIIRHELAKHGLADDLSVIVVSAEYAVRKPNPLLFEAAAGLLGVPPAQIWFLGDLHETDVIGARAAGMTPFLYASRPIADCADVDVVTTTWPNFVKYFRDASACGSREPAGRSQHSL
jgi:putative hydrolase of the HAD superfamily